jgi:DNA-binding response OmpR family regulator
VEILVVDDDVFVPLLISLELQDAVIREATRISDGYQLALMERPDAIVVDRGLPDGDGLDLVRQIRRDSRIARTPIIVLTAGFREDDRMEVTRAGADDFMGKPFEPIALFERLMFVHRLPPAQRRTRRATMVTRLRSGLPSTEVEVPHGTIDLTASSDPALTGDGRLSRWRSRRP